MRTGERAVLWAREVVDRFGEPAETLPGISAGPVWVIRMTQADLAKTAGLACSTGTVARYLSQLGDAVLRRRPGIIIDASRFASLVAQLEGQRAEVPLPTSMVARDLLFGGLAAPHDAGTALASRERPGQPASIREMATVAGLTHKTLRRHIAVLEAAGRLVTIGRWRVFPASLRQVPADAEAGGVLAELREIADRLAHLCAHAERISTQSGDVGQAALQLRISRLYDHAFAILDDCGIDPLAGDAMGGAS